MKNNAFYSIWWIFFFFPAICYYMKPGGKREYCYKEKHCEAKCRRDGRGSGHCPYSSPSEVGNLPRCICSADAVQMKGWTCEIF